MKKITNFVVLGAASIALTACGGSDDASSELDVETVEMPAEEALEPVTEEPVADPAAAETEDVAGPPPVDTQTAQEAADAAEGVADAVAAAEAAEAALAAEAAEAAADLDIE